MVAPALQARADRVGLGILLMLTAWAMFAVVDTTVKWLVVAGVPALFLAFVRYIVAFGFSLLRVRTSGPIQWDMDRATWRILILRGFLLATTTAMNFFALRFLPLTVTSAILFSSPILVCALSAPLLGERVGKVRVAAILIGFLGVLVVIRPFNEEFDWAALLVLYNATALALFSILTRKLSGAVSSTVQQVTMNGIGVLLTAPILPWVWTNPRSFFDVGLFVMIGFFAWAGHEAFSRAHLYGKAASLMPYSYSFLLYLTFSSWLVFGDLPDQATVLGALIITASGLIIWWRENGRRAE